MEHFIEGVLEFLFGLAKDKPDKMPEMEYKNRFVVKHNPKKIAMRIVASFIFIAVFVVLCFFVEHDTRFLFFLFIGLSAFILLLSAGTLSFKCVVTEESLSKTSFLYSKRRSAGKISFV